MIFDLEQALCLPTIRHIISSRNEVLERFGPVFRNPTHLKKQDYLDFLSFDNNHHWSGLERLGRRASDNIENLRAALSVLIDERTPLPDRYDRCLTQIEGIGNATISAILLVAYPNHYGVWNGTSEAEMRERNLWPTFARGLSPGEKYEIINKVLLGLAQEHGIDTWTLDALWWAEKLDRQQKGRYKDAWFKAVWSMADQAEQTTKQSNGQEISRTLKNKDLRFSKEILISYIYELLKENNYRCAITGLLLEPDGSDPQLRPSLDRIDSNGHYEIDNLQVVARFINFWKGNSPDAEFRRLLSLLRGE